MHATDLRAAISARLTALDITVHHAAKLADLSDQTARDYFAGRDLSSERVLRLAAAVGLEISAKPIRRFSPEKPASAGRPKKRPEKSGY